MCGDLSPVLNSRVNNCQTRGWTKASRGEREPGQVAGWPASALWPPSQWDTGCMILVIPPPHPPAHIHTPLDTSAPCDKLFVINRVLIMPAEYRMCLMSNCLDWLDVTERYCAVCYRWWKSSGFRSTGLQVVYSSHAVCSCATALPSDN